MLPAEALEAEEDAAAASAAALKEVCWHTSLLALKWLLCFSPLKHGACQQESCLCGCQRSSQRQSPWNGLKAACFVSWRPGLKLLLYCELERMLQLPMQLPLRGHTSPHRGSPS